MIIDLKQLTAKAHGSYIAEPYSFNQSAGTDPIDLYNISEAKALGTPYFMTLTLQSKQKVFKLPNEPLVTLFLQKTIVETPTVGEERKGTVKEYICTEDYQIDIKGICIGENDNYPAKQVKLLNDLFAINEAVEVKDNLFFTLFGIQKIVLKSIKFEEMVGEESLQKYIISAVSATDFFAELTERSNLLGGR